MLSFVSIGSAFLAVTLFTTAARWLERPALGRNGRFREPTDDELKQLQSTFEAYPEIAEMPVQIFEGTGEIETATLAAPIGHPVRRSFVVGSEFFDQDPEVIRGIMSLQGSRLENGVYDRKFAAETIRMGLLLALIVYLFPPLPPGPDPLLAVGSIAGTVVVSIALEYWVRSSIYASDRQAAAATGAKRIEEGLLVYVRQADMSMSPSRITQHVEFAPSIEDRIAKLRSVRTGD